MQNPQSQFDAHLNQTFQDIVFLLRSRIELLKQLSADENQILWSMGAIFGIFYVVHQSLLDNLIVTLSWLFSKRDNKSLIWYLNQVREHSASFSRDEIDEQLNQIDALEDTIERVKTVRDKCTVHRDPNAVNNREKFLTENKLELADFENLINLAERIINCHFGRFQDTTLDFGLPSNDVGALARCLEQRAELLRFLEEFDISNKKPDFVERILCARKNLSI